MHIVLVEPEIPANTGNIARTCAVTGSALHLVRPLGFSTDDRQLKRAGLDYWSLLDITYYDGLDDFLDKHPGGQFHFASTKGGHWYSDVKYGMDDFLVFGKETKGLPAELIQARTEQVVRIPMLNDAKARSLNLSNAVAILAFEALRQNSFPGMI